MRKINKIILHCSATMMGKNFTAKDIDQWHRRQGFQMIGYHYVILLDGTVEIGRPLELPGAHTYGHNDDSIGICYIGGLDHYSKSKDTRTKQQRHALKQLIDELQTRFPNATVHGHREFANKDCPCFEVENLASPDYKTTSQLVVR